jgi:hypothetical protein
MKVQVSETLPDSPFPGIRPFSYADRAIFFARDNEVRTFLRLIRLYRGTLLYSPPGAGKSSLLNAGLIPVAIEEGFEPTRIRVQPKPDEEIIIERVSSHRDGAPPFLPSIFVTETEADRVVLSVPKFLSALSSNRTVRPLLILDQFEEWITLSEENMVTLDRTTTMNAFKAISRAIVSIIANESIFAKVVLSFREDYLAKLDSLFEACPSWPL